MRKKIREKSIPTISTADIATKDDFRRFSLTLLKTQEDVRHIRTIMGTKDDLRKVSLEILKTQEDLQNIKAIMTTKKIKEIGRR